jgi:hypothetical protein
MAKNGFQYVPATTEAWVFVETDPDVEMYATIPTVPGTAFNLLLKWRRRRARRMPVSSRPGSASPACRSTRRPCANHVRRLPLRVLSSGEQIGNDPTAAGAVAKVTWNKARHWRGAGQLNLD